MAMRLKKMQEKDAFIPACGVSVRASGSTAVVEPESLQVSFSVLLSHSSF
jgi:hypothetical protein